MLDLAVTDMAWDSGHDLLIATTPPTAAHDASSLVAVDVPTWSIVNRVAVGGAPGAVKVSKDGLVAYVLFPDEALVREYSLPSLTPTRQISTLIDPLATKRPAGLDIMPGNDEVVAIAMSKDSTTPESGGVAIFDHGVVRPATALDGETGGFHIAFGADGSHLYASAYLSFIRLTVDSAGVTVADRTSPNPLPGLAGIVYSGGLVYDDQRGIVLDPAVPAMAGQFTSAEYFNGITIDASQNRAYSIAFYSMGTASTYELLQWDLTTRQELGRLLFPQSPWLPGKMVSLGKGWEAVAMSPQITRSPDGQLMLIRPGMFDGSLGEYTPLTPSRVLDTRDGTGRSGEIRPVAPGETINVQITGHGGVPVAGVDAVVLNATVTDTTAPGYLTIWPSGVPDRPTISSVNFVAGQTVPNLVTVTLGYDGALSVFNSFGFTDVIFDVAGFYSASDGPHGQRFHPLTPSRLFDTRDGTAGVRPKLRPGDEVSFKVTGTGGVPGGATAVVMNVTVTRTTTPGFLTVYPADVTRPVVSNLNFVPGQTVPNLVIVRVPATGLVNFFNSSGNTDVLADVVGYYDGDTASQSGRLFTFIPFRALDTRESSPFPDNGKMWPESSMWIGSANDQSSAYVLNVTVTEPEGPGYLTVYPRSDYNAPPFASNLNFITGQTVANAVIVGTGPYIGFYNATSYTHVVVDVFGYFT